MLVWLGVSEAEALSKQAQRFCKRLQASILRSLIYFAIRQIAGDLPDLCLKTANSSACALQVVLPVPLTDAEVEDVHKVRPSAPGIGQTHLQVFAGRHALSST